jgi:hypothetical protein
MPFTAQELQNITNAVLDYHIRGKVESQVIQDRPLYNDLKKGQKSFPGGKEFITGRVKGVYTSSMVRATATTTSSPTPTRRTSSSGRRSGTRWAPASRSRTPS